MSQAYFTECYRKWCKRHWYNFNFVKTAEIYAEAKNLIAMISKDAITKLLIQQAIDQLNTIFKTVKLLRAEIRHFTEQFPEYSIVMSMYGVGGALGPQLMSEIWDVMHFERRNLLTAFAGNDLGSNQCGTYEAKSSPAAKHGSSEPLFLVMDVLIKNPPPDDPVFRFMDKKRAEGKLHFVYITAGANKFLRIYCGKVKKYLISLLGFYFAGSQITSHH